MKKIFFLLCLFLFASCTRWTEQIPFLKKTPEEVVQHFVTLSAGAKGLSDKKALESFSGGDLEKAFQKLTEEDFKRIYLDAKIKLLSFKVISSEAKDKAAKVTYEVNVENSTGQETTLETNLREALLEDKGGKWIIVAIQLSGKDQLTFTKGIVF